MVIPERADIVVVGGGPAGSSTATHLARAGLDVLLLDKARFPRAKACAEYCSPGVVDALDDLGALKRIRKRQHRDLASMRITTPDNGFPLSFADDRPSGNQAMGVKRSVLDEELLLFAAGNGARVMQGVRVTAPIVERGRVVGVRCRIGSYEVEVRAGFVVAADGIHSTVSRALDNDRTVRWPRRLGLVARYRSAGDIAGTGQMHVGNGIYCGLSPVAECEINVSLVVPMGAKPDRVRTGDFFEATIDRLTGVARALSGAERISKIRGIGPLGRRVRSVAGRGYLLVGDAAGFFDPLTGEGIHRALRGGEMAASATLAALDRPDRYPAGYERSRMESFGDKERVCQIIQLLLEFPRLRDYAARRATSRTAVQRDLTGVLGDYAPASNALRPAFLWSLFRP